MKNGFIIYTFLVFGLIACKNPDQQNKMTWSEHFENTDVGSSATDKETIVYDYTYFPVIDSNSSLKVLTVGYFHNDEVWSDADKETWFGLFKNEAHFYIGETQLNLKKVHDDLVDEDGQKTGWKVQTKNKDTSMVLIEKVDYLTERSVEHIVLSKEILYPGDTLKINHLTVDYKLFATGEKRASQDDSGWYDVWNYKLYIAAIINGQEQKSLLVAQPNFDDRMIQLLFAGDIDGDGIVDLIIDTSRHYNSRSPTVYLSKPASDGEIVKPVGEHTIVGC